MASLLCTVGEGTDNLLARIKGAVAMEYIPAGEHFEEGSLNILVQHNDTFEWMDVAYCIPVGSERHYTREPVGTITMVKKLPT